MKSKLVWEKACERISVLVLDSGEEAVAAITCFAQREGWRFASLTVIGAFQIALVGWFDFDAKTHHQIPIEQQREAGSLIGDVAPNDGGQPNLHVDAVLGLSNGSTRRARSDRATYAGVPVPAHLRTKRRPDLGIALISLV